MRSFCVGVALLLWLAFAHSAGAAKSLGDKCRSEIILSRLPEPELLGSSDAMNELRNLIERVGRTQATVLITGESGTGKDVVARRLILAGARRDAPYVAVNFAGLNEGIVDSTLFGHARGSFTGAASDHRGLFERADGGTLFLDEIGDTPISIQIKLLRVLESRTFERVGGEEVIPVNTRLIAATNVDLSSEKTREEKGFRDDLYYRLGIVELRVPPLRERRDDIPELVEHFVKKFCELHGFSVKSVPSKILAALVEKDWRGNVRELAGVIESAVVLSGDRDTIEPDDLKPQFRPRKSKFAAQLETFDAAQKRHLIRALSLARMDYTVAARLAGLDKKALSQVLWSCKISEAEKVDIARELPVPENRQEEARTFLTLQEFRRKHINAALDLTHDDRYEAAGLLGIRQQTLGKWITDLGIARPNAESNEPK